MNSQQETIDFLERPESYGTPVEPVECVETHGSLIFLHGAYAYKLKRAVAYAALDFLSLESRDRACHAELLLNRRTAPNLYLAVRSINRGKNGQLEFDGQGETLDWVVVMRRFEQNALFERMASEGQLTSSLMERLGEEIARFHALAEIAPKFGGAASIREAIEANHRELSRYPQLLDPVAVQALHHISHSVLESLGAELDQRRMQGQVRRCHGDLRLANICLFDGRPTLFDGIEFSERIACIDVLYDLAFVLMDLQHHGLIELSERLLDSYQRHNKTAGNYRALALFLSVRAATRSYSLACSFTRQQDIAMQQDKGLRARALLQQAKAYLYHDNVLSKRSW